jgi:hypothetical protein
MFRRFKPLRLSGQMAGNALVKPALNLGGKMNEMGRHVGSPLQVPGSEPIEPGDARVPASKMHIASLADRFQYLSVNNP